MSFPLNLGLLDFSLTANCEKMFFILMNFLEKNDTPIFFNH